jgi:P27 family predicted phage terminase small subunit
MRPGPRPKPTALKLLEGNPGKKRLNAREPRPTVEIPTCPAGLKPEARKEWRRLSKLLQAQGLIARLDRAALAVYCQAWARWLEAEQKVQEGGEIVKSPNGYPIQNPWLSIANAAAKEVRAFLQEFGLSPAARTRLHVVPKSSERDAFEEFLFGSAN